MQYKIAPTVAEGAADKFMGVAMDGWPTLYIYGPYDSNAFREPIVSHLELFSQMESIFTFSVDIFFTFSYLFTYRGIVTFDGATAVAYVNR